MYAKNIFEGLML